MDGIVCSKRRQAEGAVSVSLSIRPFGLSIRDPGKQRVPYHSVCFTWSRLATSRLQSEGLAPCAVGFLVMCLSISPSIRLSV
jgi:hypothetical protein